MRKIAAIILVILPLVVSQTGCRSCQPRYGGAATQHCSSSCGDTASDWASTPSSETGPADSQDSEGPRTAERPNGMFVPLPPDVI